MPIAPSRSGKGVIALAIIMIFIAIVGRAVYLTQPVSSDTAMFVYQGKLVHDGGKIGIDLIDNKLPSVGMLMSVPYRAFGANWQAYTSLGLALTIVSSAMLARTAGRCLGSQARLPVGVAAMLWLNLPPVVYGQLQLETIQVFFVTVAACASMELLTRKDWRDAIVIGLSVGIAMWAKPTSGAILPAIGLAIIVANTWTWRDRIKSFAAIACAFAIPTAICIWLLCVTGMVQSLPETFRQLHDYSSNSTAQWSDFSKPLFVLSVLMFPVLVLGYVFRRDRCFATNTTSGITTFVIAWLIMETLGVIAQRRMYAYHFLVMGPPAALMLGLFARRLRLASLGFALGPVAIICMIWSVELLNWPDRQARMTAVIDYINQAAKPGTTVWMDDYPRLMVETDFKPGSRVPLTFLFGNSDQAPLHFSKIILDDFQQNQPEWLVLYGDVDRYIDFYHHHMVEIAAFPQRGANFSKAWRDIDAYARSRYVVVQKIDKIEILRRVGLASTDVR